MSEKKKDTWESTRKKVSKAWDEAIAKTPTEIEFNIKDAKIEFDHNAETSLGGMGIADDKADDIYVAWIQNFTEIEKLMPRTACIAKMLDIFKPNTVAEIIAVYSITDKIIEAHRQEMSQFSELLSDALSSISDIHEKRKSDESKAAQSIMNWGNNKAEA